jgi:glycerate 2-kinase
MKDAATLRNDALQIWRSGVEAVRAERLVGETLRLEGDRLAVGAERLDLNFVRRIAVVGAGKAGAGMASAVEQILGPKWLDAKQVHGWVNVPADCVGNRPDFCGAKMELSPLPMPQPQRIRLHAARLPGVNEPSAEGVRGTAAILQIVQSLTADDLCLCLLSGGGSALLPAPAEGITLEDKLAVTRHLSAAGANIGQLNTVRKQLSRIKGGGLARACRAGRLIALIISDVPGDPLDMIASGPTAPDSSTPRAALEILEQFQARAAGVAPAVFDYLADQIQKKSTSTGRRAFLSGAKETDKNVCLPEAARVTNLIIGNNAKAIDAAGREAVRLGYTPACVSATQPEGPAEDVGWQLAEQALQMRQGAGPDCFISGGEPVVRLAAADRRGLGGRNQQLVLAALERLVSEKGNSPHLCHRPFRQMGTGLEGIVLVSGGTDGEDGPTDAAGAVLDEDVLRTTLERGLDPRGFLARNDAYHFFASVEALIKTGPTHTNVGDLRVILVSRGCGQPPVGGGGG